MASTVFAMDTGFFSSLGSYAFEARCEMLERVMDLRSAGARVCEA
jgi:hypothetical protein